MTNLVYLEDSYKKSLNTKIVSITIKGDHWEVIMAETIFYPEGGGQPADKGEIEGKKGKLIVSHVRMHDKDVVHEGKLIGDLRLGELVTARIDWELRYDHMRWHSAGHIIHEVVKELIPTLVPVRGEHGRHAYIEYEGQIHLKLRETIEKRTNMLIAEERQLSTEFVTLEELIKRAPWVPPHLPKNKPLRILQIAGYPPIPDGGTQVKSTVEVGFIKIREIEQLGTLVRVHYDVPAQPISKTIKVEKKIVSPAAITLNHFRSLLLEMENELLETISHTLPEDLELLHVHYFGAHGKVTLLVKRLKELPADQRKNAGLLVNQFKQSVETAFRKQESVELALKEDKWIDVSLPGIRPPQGHLHIVTQAIMEITRIFERIGFTRVRHQEVDWDWYAFESLNMPPNHPARDEWETFFIEYPRKPDSSSDGGRLSWRSHDTSEVEKTGNRRKNIVLTPHTSNGQVREMEKGKLPIRMINIAKCYRRQSDISHTPMFHQFEGMYIDKNVSIVHLKGVFDYFVKQFYGPTRQIRLRPFHFQFTEPSFEVDITCDICLGTGRIKGQKCRLCKEGWLEMAGAGMIHPMVLKNGGIDPIKYSGFAFGWGVERAFMMKSGIKIDDLRLIYSNDLRFLEQF